MHFDQNYWLDGLTITKIITRSVKVEISYFFTSDGDTISRASGTSRFLRSGHGPVPCRYSDWIQELMTTVVTVDVTVEVTVFWWGSKFPKKYNRCWGLNLAGTRPSTDEMAPSPSFTAANGESFPNQITLNTTPSNLSSSNRQINAPVPRTTGRRREEGTDQRRCYGRWQHGGPSETATARTTADRKDPPNSSTKAKPISSAIINQSAYNTNSSIMIRYYKWLR